MKNIAILTGGDSEERVISLKSGQVVHDHLPKDRYRLYIGLLYSLPFLYLFLSTVGVGAKPLE